MCECISETERIIEIIHKRIADLKTLTYSFLKLLCTHTKGFVIWLVSDIEEGGVDSGGAGALGEHLLLALKLKRSLFALELNSVLEYSNLVWVYLQ